MATDGNRWKAVTLVALGIVLGVALTASPATSHVAGWAHNWKKHVKPKADKRYLPGGNLPRGRTVRGGYVVRDFAAGMSPSAANISFGFTLRSAPTPHLIEAGDPPTSACPGTPSNPRAAVGHLCIYEAAFSNIASYTIVGQTTGVANTASRWGAVLRVTSAGAGGFSTMGTWAVTAP
jgi:hypothetical protein